MNMQKLKLLPKHTDPEVLADQNRIFEGEYSTDTMHRLIKITPEISPVIHLNLSFSRGILGLPMATGNFKTSLTLKCERCLDPLVYEINSEIEVTIKPKSMNLEGQVENSEIFEYDGQSLNLSELIEDELILVVPLVPKHRDISQCNQDMIAWLAPTKDAVQEVDNPFAILKR